MSGGRACSSPILSFALARSHFIHTHTRTAIFLCGRLVHTNQACNPNFLKGVISLEEFLQVDHHYVYRDGCI